MNMRARRKLVNEIKDYDKNMNGGVVSMQKNAKYWGQLRLLNLIHRLMSKILKKWKK